jgi:hypothetical protein
MKKATAERSFICDCADACRNHDAVTTAVGCQTAMAEETSVCEVLDCATCINNGYTLACSYCSDGASRNFCSSQSCAAPLMSLYDAGVCPPLAPTACSLVTDCTQCIAQSGCSYCAQAGVYGFCVTGSNVCTHNDSVTTTTACNAINFVTPSVCDVGLSCNQCLGTIGLGCSW